MLKTPQHAYNTGEAVTKKNERGPNGEYIQRRYYICCVKWNKKLREIQYRVKTSKTEGPGDKWMSERELRLLGEPI